MAEGQEKISWYRKEIYGQIVSLVFEISLISYLFFYLVETLSVSFISRFYSLNYHLIFVIIFGVLTVIITFDKKEEKIVRPETKVRVKDYILIFILAFASSGIIWFKTKELGRLSLAIGALSGLIILFLSFLLMKDKDDKDFEE